mmetsp:Transcript_8563/g.21286  ORF Transcript_8563/g.21286 Transcript_8563/m.21286 type:complete len:220 (-) Transcript_8563:41-700(-)
MSEEPSTPTEALFPSSLIGGEHRLLLLRESQLDHHRPRASVDRQPGVLGSSAELFTDVPRKPPLVDVPGNSVVLGVVLVLGHRERLLPQVLPHHLEPDGHDAERVPPPVQPYLQRVLPPCHDDIPQRLPGERLPLRHRDLVALIHLRKEGRHVEFVPFRHPQRNAGTRLRCQRRSSALRCDPAPKRCAGLDTGLKRSEGEGVDRREGREDSAHADGAHL